MPPRIPDNTRVKLRDGIEPVFYDGYGLPGNEGWVRKHEFDRYGLARVYIEWDKNHWAYNGAPDKWTWEEHFDIVEEIMSEQTTSKQEQLSSLLGAFGDSLLEIFGDDGERSAETTTVEIPDAPKDPTSGGEEDGEEPSYEDILKAALKASIDAESFFVLAIRKDEKEGVIFPLVYHASRTPTASLIAQLQLSHVASSFHGKLIGEALQQAAEEDGE